MAAAEPLVRPVPADATQAAPMWAMDAGSAGASGSLTRRAMVIAAALPITPDGMPVRGGAGAMRVPLGVLCGWEMAWGGANAMPTAKMFGYPGTS